MISFVTNRNQLANKRSAKNSTTKASVQEDAALRSYILNIDGSYKNKDLNGFQTKQLIQLLRDVYGMNQNEIATVRRGGRIHKSSNKLSKEKEGFKWERKNDRKKRRNAKRQRAQNEARMAGRRAEAKTNRYAEHARRSLQKTKRTIAPWLL